MTRNTHFGQALEFLNQSRLASEAYSEALKRGQVGLDQVSTSFGSPRAAQRLYSASISALGRQVNLAGGNARAEEKTRLANEVGMLKGAIHDRLLLANRMPYEIDHAQARELQQNMQKSHEQVVATWNEKQAIDTANFSNYANSKNQLAKVAGPWLQTYVAKRFDRFALDRALEELPRDSAAIDYFLADGLPGQSRYWAFVHRRGKPVQMLNLGNAAEIDRWVDQLRQDILDVNESRILASASRLGELIWAPIAPLLTDATNITVSPDGQLLLLPFDVIRFKGMYLLEQVNVRMVNSLRDLTPMMTAGAVQPTQSVLVGDPDFGQAPKGGNTQRTIHFDQLPGTRQEVMQVAQRLKTSGHASKVLLGKDASLDNLRQVRSPRFLHLASHGYFLDEAQEKLDVSPGNDLRNETVALRSARPSMPSMGIALEQANVASPSSSLLTADKISSIDLRGTELVVLSACDTGLGKPRTGEGVRSLRSSFQIAGAKQVLASLWYVPDEAMKTLMDAFYSGVLAAEPPYVALKKAKLELMKKNSNPFYWGAASVFTAL